MPTNSPPPSPTAHAPTRRPGFDPITRYAIVVVLCNLAAIAWGAFVRATGPGAGCGGHWPACDGAVVARTPASATLIELTHRGTQGIAAILVFALTWWVFRVHATGHPARRAAAASSLLVVVVTLLGAGQGMLGWTGDDASWGRVLAPALQLATAHFLLAALVLTAWRLGGGAGNRWLAEGVDGALVVTTLAMTGVVALTGAITALGDTLLPATSLADGAAQHVAPMSHFLARLRVVHPILAVLTSVAIIRAAWLLSRRRASPLTSRLARLVTGLVVVQLAVGAISLVARAPVPLQLVHLLVANALWMGLVLLGAQALARAQQAD